MLEKRYNQYYYLYWDDDKGTCLKIFNINLFPANFNNFFIDV